MKTQQEDINHEFSLNGIFKMAAIYWVGVALLIGAFMGLFGLS